MATFNYKVRDNTGRLIAGQLEADNSDLAAQKLKNLGFVPVEISESMKIYPFFKKIIPTTKINIRKICVFTRQLATLQKTKVSLINNL